MSTEPLVVPSEEDLLKARQQIQGRKEASPSSGPGAVPTWKLTRARHVYTLGGLSLALRALPRRPASIAYEAIRSLPIMLQVAAQCGIESESRLDFERAAAILTAFHGEAFSPELASAAWRDFVTSDEFSDGVGLLADALFPFLDDPHAQGLAWPRPAAPPYPAGSEDETPLPEEAIEAWQVESETLVREALPTGCRWLDDAIEDELHELEIPMLLAIIFDIQGGYPGDIRARFTQP